MKKSKNMKRLSLSLAALLLTLCACGGTSETQQTTAAPESSTATPSEAVSSSEPAGSGEASDESQGSAEETELIVFAAASMTETLTELQSAFEDAHPGVKLVFNFDSSGTLKTQIQEGASCDVFISAGQKQMDQLDISADPSVNEEGLDFVLEDTRIDFLENKVTLCVPEGSDKVSSFDDLAAGLEDGSVFLCMGNSDVPVGQYTQKILAYYNLDETELANAGCITYGSNVKEVTTQVSEGSVDAGVIYCTDAYSAGLTPVDYATAEMCGQVIYPAAVLNISEHPEIAQEYLDFLVSDEAMPTFEEVGFSQVN